MSLPIIERITDNVVADLKKIRTANGYSFNAIVERVNEEDNQINRSRDGLIVVGHSVEPNDTAPQGHDEWLITYTLELTSVESESSAIPSDARLGRRLQDIVKAIMVDRHRGALALNTTVGTPSMSADRRSGSLTFTVHYRTLLNDPFNQ